MLPLTIVAIVKNEAPYLEEWMEYHRERFGASFVLGINDCPESRSVALRLSVAGDCILDVTGANKQLPFYREMIAEVLGIGWVAFIDVDEFIEDGAALALKEVLERGERESWPAVGLNWRLYGPCGQYVNDGRPVQQRFRGPWTGDRHIKSIVRFPLLEKLVLRDPHYIVSGTRDVLGKELTGPLSEAPLMGGPMVAHYFTKSVMEFVDKCSRGRADGGESHDPAHWLRHFQSIGG